MKTIIITENQLKNLIEGSSIDAPNFNNGDIKEFNDSEVMTTTNVTNQDCYKNYGKPTVTDKVQATLSPQNNWSNSRLSNRRMP